MNNLYVGEGSDPGLGQVMQFTVQSGTAVPPPTLNPALFPQRAVLATNAPTRFKVLRVFDDERPDGDSCPDPALPNCNQRSIDGLEFSAPATELPLVNSTEEWDLIHMMEPRQDDQDKNFHQIHIHLIEFQVLNRQPFDSVRYRQDWHLLNGHMPVTRPVVLDPTPYFTGPPVPPAPYETGWKDTVQAMPAMVNRIIVRWGPQESTNNTPGVNQFATIDPTSFPDNVKGPGYVWHCHIVGHEDHDMLRQLALVNSWKAGTAYVAENVVEFNQVDYRARVNNTAVAGQTPPYPLRSVGSGQQQRRLLAAADPLRPGRQGYVQRRAVPSALGVPVADRANAPQQSIVVGVAAADLLRPVRPVLPRELQSQCGSVPPRRSGWQRGRVQGRGRAVPGLLQPASPPALRRTLQ